MNKIYSVLLAVVALVMCACNGDEYSPLMQEGKKLLRFKVDVNKPSFDGGTRATDVGWEQGDSLFLRFTTTNGYTYGVAVYDDETSDWVMNDAPALDLEVTKKLEIAFFDGDKTIDGQNVTLNPTTAVYTDDGNGTYLLTMANEFVPVIKGHLVPRTARIRFKGEVGTTIIVGGLKYYDTFDMSKVTGTMSNNSVVLTVDSDGYTDYTYCFFSNDSHVMSVAQNVSVGSNVYRYTYTTTCTSDILQAGKSGWMNIPTYNSHDGWEMTAEVLSILPAKKEIWLSGSATTEIIGIESYCDWQAESSAEWLTCKKKSDSELTISATENTSSSDRTCTISLKDEKRNTKATISVTQKSNKINGHEYVDLGLPSGLLWATCNVGASKPEDYGNYYAWGETSTKSNYSSSTSTTHAKTVDQLKSAGIIGNDGNLTASYDAANKAWGGTWRMPTLDEVKELINNTTTTWTTQNGKYGRKVTSKTNGNFIFLPAAGFLYRALLNGDGSNGSYWSSSPYTSDSNYAYYLYFNSSKFDWYYDYRKYGQSVRPVSEP